MPNHNTLTESEQMYLVTIRKICEHCDEIPIPIPQLAEELSVLPVSVNQMIKKLADAGFVTYIPYKGVELTDEGRAISTRILGHRRLWEVFLVRELKLSLREADVFACRLEHAIDEDVAQRLSTFLGDPKVCFHGSPIYNGKDSEIDVEIRLADIKIGQRCQIVRVNTDENTRSFLADEGIHAGMEAIVSAINNSGAQHLAIQNGNHLTVAQDIAVNIIVEEILE